MVWSGLIREVGSARETVDDKFLKEDVLPDAAKEVRQQRIGESFKARLRGIEPDQAPER